VRGEKICVAIRPLALLLLYLSSNTCDMGERTPAKGGDSLPRLFQRASRASDEYAAVLPEEKGNDQRAELEEMSRSYKCTAGFDPEILNNRPSLVGG
jgi:hypothetical protein